MSTYCIYFITNKKAAMKAETREKLILIIINVLFASCLLSKPAGLVS